MNNYSLRDFSIQVFNDPTYTFGSADNNFEYSKHYFGDNARQYPTSKHGVKIILDDEVVNSCVVIGSGGATDIFENSSLLDGDQILICCNTVFCLEIPTLELMWQTEVDAATCFEIYRIESDYIVHGEIEISRIDRLGNIKWQFGGSDIFVSFDDGAFELNDDGILLKDFYGVRYKLDFDGKVLWTSHPRK